MQKNSLLKNKNSKNRTRDNFKNPQKKRAVSDIISEIKGLQGQMGDVVRRMNEKVRQLEFLTDFSALLNSTLDPDTVRQKALEATCQLLGCETASILLVDFSTGELYWETALGEAGKKLQRTIRLPINNQSIAGYVVMTGDKLIINDAENDPRHFRGVKKETSFQTRNMLCIPLKSKDRIIGVLQALNKLPSVPPKSSRHAWPDFYAEDMILFETLGHQVAIAVENSQLYARLKKSFYDTVEVLADAIEKKDRITGGHTKRVVHYSMCIAKYLHLDQEEMDRVRLGAVLHDVGKIGIEDKILKKAAPLDLSEWPVMKTHPELGYQIMKRVEGLEDVLAALRLHHERWDGKGYPLGLLGEEIPLVARIIAVADTFDAMISTRPYREGLSPEVVFNEIVKNKGTQFCPHVVEAFVQAFYNEDMCAIQDDLVASVN